MGKSHCSTEDDARDFEEIASVCHGENRALGHYLLSMAAALVDENRTSWDRHGKACIETAWLFSAGVPRISWRLGVPLNTPYLSTFLLQDLGEDEATGKPGFFRIAFGRALTQSRFMREIKPGRSHPASRLAGRPTIMGNPFAIALDRAFPPVGRGSGGADILARRIATATSMSGLAVMYRWSPELIDCATCRMMAKIPPNARRHAEETMDAIETPQDPLLITAQLLARRQAAPGRQARPEKLPARHLLDLPI